MTSEMNAIIYSRKFIVGHLIQNPRKKFFDCNKACCDYKGAMSSILCESCNTWYHAVCVIIDTNLLSVLERSSCPWECPNCGLPNFSATFFDSVILVSDITITSSEESPCSTPLPTSLFVLCLIVLIF